MVELIVDWAGGRGRGCDEALFLLLLLFPCQHSQRLLSVLSFVSPSLAIFPQFRFLPSFPCLFFFVCVCLLSFLIEEEEEIEEQGGGGGEGEEQEQ